MYQRGSNITIAENDKNHTSGHDEGSQTSYDHIFFFKDQTAVQDAE